MFVSGGEPDAKGQREQVAEDDEGRQPHVRDLQFVEQRGNPRQEAQGDEVTKGGCDGRGDIVWVNFAPPR